MNTLKETSELRQFVEIRCTDIEYVNHKYGKVNISFRQNIDNYDNYKMKVRMIGFKIHKIETLKNNDNYNFIDLAILDDKVTIISNKQIRLGENGNCTRLFANRNFKSIDFNNTYTSNIINTLEMFHYATCDEINFEHLDTSNIIIMTSMFEHIMTTRLELSGFDMARVCSAYKMFQTCMASCIDMTGIKFNDNMITYDMFKGCHADLETNNKKLKHLYKVEGGRGSIRNVWN